MKSTFHVGNHYLSIHCEVACSRNCGNYIQLAMFEGMVEIDAKWEHFATQDEIQNLSGNNISLICDIMVRLQDKIDKGEIRYFEKSEHERNKERLRLLEDKKLRPNY